MDDRTGVENNVNVFTMKPEHVVLLRKGIFYDPPAMFFHGCNGRANAETVVLQVLGLDPDDVTPRRRRELMTMARETRTALDVVLSTGRFEPGCYYRHANNDWVEITQHQWWVNGPHGPQEVTFDLARRDPDAWCTPIKQVDKDPKGV